MMKNISGIHNAGRTAVISAICAGSLMMGGCASMKSTWDGMSQTGQGATAGGAAGAAVGAGVGALIGGGKGTWIGALVGSALGAGTGALVGNSMDRQKKELEQQLASLQDQTDQNSQDIAANRDAIEANRQAIESIKIESVKDSNNLDAIKVVMGDAVLFKTGKYDLSAAAQAALSRVAYNLGQFPDTDVTVVGFTDNTGSQQVNDRLSLQRAESVVSYLKQHGVKTSRLKAVGEGWNNPVASNATAEGRAQNRRVEIFITASRQMIENAESGRL